MDKFFDRVAAMWAVFMGYVQGVAQNWAEGKKPRAVGKVILPCLPVVLLGLIMWLIVKNWDAIVDFFIWLIVIFCLVGGVLSKIAERKNTEPECSEVPDMDDYEGVEITLRCAARKVPQGRYFGRIYEETNIRVNADEMIIPKGDFLRLKYRLPIVEDTSKTVDRKHVQEILQKEVLTVLKDENPANMAPAVLVHDGVSDCIIQIDDVELSDDYVYVFCVLATPEYFAQRREQKAKQKKPAPPVPQDPLFKK